MPKLGGAAAGLLLIYCGLLTCAHYWDGVLFSLYIEKVQRGEYQPTVLFHPNHLLYSAAGYAIYLGLRVLHLRAITCLALWNAAAATAAAVWMWRTAARLTGSTTLTVAATALFAFGATWWKFSTDADAYVPAVLLVALAVDAAWNGRAVAASLLHAGAMLLHQASIFAALPICAALWLATPQFRRRALAIYATASLALVSTAYALAFEYAGRLTKPSFWNWVTSFSDETKVTVTAGQLVTAYPLSYAKLLAGGKFSLVRDFLSWPVVASLMLAAALLVVASVLIYRPPAVASRRAVNRNIKLVLWLWIAPYALFLAWFEPGNAFYKLFLWPPVVLLLAILFAEHPHWRVRERALLALTGALAAWNLAAFIYPHTQPQSDPVFALAKTIDRELPPNATIYYEKFVTDDWYLDYFAPGRRWLHVATAIKLPACLETTAVSSPAWKKNVLSWAETQSWRLVDGKHNVQLVCYAHQ